MACTRVPARRRSAWSSCTARTPSSNARLAGGARTPSRTSSLSSKTRRPPLCECGGFLKPATISFGQNLRNEDLERAEAAAKAADLVVALGSTLSVYPAANIPLVGREPGHALRDHQSRPDRA